MTGGLTDDVFLGGKLSILQPEKGYRAGLDAVLLAAAVDVEPGRDAAVLDAGAGVGVVGLAIAVRATAARVTMVEVDAVLAGLARQNAERNGLGDRVRVVVADIAQGGRVLHDMRDGTLVPGSFDHVISNPPFYAAGSGTEPSDRRKAVSHQMVEGSLDKWIAFLATAARSGGQLTLIHRADAIGQILTALDGRFGAIAVLPVHPRAGAAAARVIVRGVKGSRAPLEIRAGLVLHESDGRYRPEVEAVLRHGAALRM